LHCVLHWTESSSALSVLAFREKYSQSTAYFYQNSSPKGQGWFICKAACIWLLFNSKNVKSRNYKATLFIWQGQIFLGNWIKPLINSILFIGSIFLPLTFDTHLSSALCNVSLVRGLLAKPRACTCSGSLQPSCARGMTSHTPTASRGLWIWAAAWSPGNASDPVPAIQDLSRSWELLALRWDGVTGCDPGFFHCKAKPAKVNHHQAQLGVLVRCWGFFPASLRNVPVCFEILTLLPLVATWGSGQAECYRNLVLN